MWKVQGLCLDSAFVCGCPVVLALFVEKSIFAPHYIVFAPLSRISYLYLCEFISGMSILFHLSICIYILPIPHCLDYCSFVISLEVGSVSSPTLLFSNIVLAILSLLPFHLNFKTSLSVSTKELAGILIGIALSLWIKLGRTDILTILSLLIHDCGISLH